MALLPRQQTLDTSTGRPWSLPRDNALRDTLEAAFDAILPPGVVSGGTVTATTGYGVEVASGSVFWSSGVLVTLASAQAYAAATNPSTTIYLWGKLTRTAGTQTDPTADDTHALTLTHNTTGTSPGAEYFPVATWATDGSGVTGSINNNPAGKFVRAVQQRGRLAKTITDANTTLSTVEASARILEISGTLTASRDIILPNNDGQEYVVYNATGQNLVFKVSGQTGVTVATTKRALIYCNGTDYKRVTPDT
jgi:hypothetical protein